MNTLKHDILAISYKSVVGQIRGLAKLRCEVADEVA
jgi:hypothetical protein